MKWFLRNAIDMDPVIYTDDDGVIHAATRADAEHIVADVNRLADERDVLLAACKAIDEELRLLAAQGRAREKPSLDVIGQVRAAIAKAEGGAE